MNAISSGQRDSGLASLHLAAIAFAYPVAEGRLSFSDASSCLARAAVASGAASGGLGRLDRLCSDLEHVLLNAIATVHAAAVEDVRRGLKLCRRREVGEEVHESVAFAINSEHGYCLTPDVIDALIKEGVG